MRLFFVGIGGIGTSALAQLCANRGDEVLGSNLGTTAIWPQLETAGITLFDDHSAEQLPIDTDLLIYSEAVPKDNPERTKARNLDIPQMSYFAYLGEVSKDYRTIAVTGTHGKTSTSGMMASGFLMAQFPATMIVGSKLQEFGGSNFYQSRDLDPGIKPWLIVEACEYRNNFQYLNPEIVIVTNLELDHVDYYESEDHYIQTFADFCGKAKTVVYHEGEPLIQKVLNNFTGTKAAVPKEATKNLSLSVSGEHNRQNAALTIAAAAHVDNLDLIPFRQGVAAYKGAWRRMEHLGDVNGVAIYDDYGHHPTEIIATLQAVQERHPDSRIGLIFEPHQYSRTKEFFTAFCLSFEAADLVGLHPIYAARDTEADKAAISRQHFIDHNPTIERVDDLSMAQSFAAELKKEDVLIFMGAGNISTLAHEYTNHGNK